MIDSLKFYQNRVQNAEFLKMEQFHLQIRQNKKVICFQRKSEPNSIRVEILREYFWADPGGFDMPILFTLFLRFSLTFLNA